MADVQEEPPGAPAEAEQAAVVAISSSSEEEGQSRQDSQQAEEALVAAYAALRKAKEALRKKQEQLSGRGAGASPVFLGDLLDSRESQGPSCFEGCVPSTARACASLASSSQARADSRGRQA